MIYPLRKIHITQRFGQNPQIYRRFGLRGHNGIDFRVRFGGARGKYKNSSITINGKRYRERTESGKIFLLSPVNGTIKFARMDKKGYGYHYRIIDEQGGEHVLAHNSTLFYRAGKRVKEGEVIGLTGNTGFSSGAHLHHGYRPKGYNPHNGYAGYVDQLKKMYNKPSNVKTDNNKSMKVSKEFRQVIKSLTGEDIGAKMNENEMKRVAKNLQSLQNEFAQTITQLKKKQNQMQESIARKNGHINELNQKLRITNSQIAEMKTDLGLCRRALETARDIKKSNDEALSVNEVTKLVTAKDWKRAGWTLLNFAMAAIVSYLTYLATDENVAVAGAILPFATALAQFVTKKLNK